MLLLRPVLAETPAPAPGSLHNLTPAANRALQPAAASRTAPAADPVVPPSRKDVPPASQFSFITVLAPLVLARRW